MMNSYSLKRAGDYAARSCSPRTIGAGGDATTWRALPRPAQLYVALVIAAGAALTVLQFPTVVPDPVLFAALLALSCVTSAWKVTLPLSLSSGSTLSVSYAAALMALL